MQSIKIPKNETIATAEAIPFVSSVIERMMEAGVKDRELAKQGITQFYKMALLPRAIGVMCKTAFSNIFVSSGGCKAVGFWIKRNDDGSPCSQQLKSQLLSCCARMPITKEALADCGEYPLGIYVKEIAQDVAESIHNRKLAGMLLQRWVQQVLVVADEPDEKAEDDSKKVGRLERKPPETEESLRLSAIESEGRRHPKIPMGMAYEFAIQPTPVYEAVKREKWNPDSNRGKLNSTLNIMMRPNKAVWKPYHVSIAGRTVNVDTGP